MEHTKGEWKATDYVMVDGKRRYDVETADEVIAMDVSRANAERIVKAVNCHDDLVEALKEAINALTIKLDKPKYPEILDFKSRVEPMILQALAKAEGK
ncbi:hypothetical protein LCGC14_2781090 [marine sediment metagenome]|uniref:Uncharacterized protein n=1 Tax=marine sediment metagenome TaxID=412755 RepID=A0A0F9B1Y5_9ZZZZ